jgi:hypothetical protein
MPRRPKTEVPGMWINPNSTLSRGHIAWDRHKKDAVSARYLDLAEIALRKQLIECKSPETYFAAADNIANDDFRYPNPPKGPRTDRPTLDTNGESSPKCAPPGRSPAAMVGETLIARQ